MISDPPPTPAERQHSVGHATTGADTKAPSTETTTKQKKLSGNVGSTDVKQQGRPRDTTAKLSKGNEASASNMARSRKATAEPKRGLDSSIRTPQNLKEAASSRPTSKTVSTNSPSHNTETLTADTVLKTSTAPKAARALPTVLTQNTPPITDQFLRGEPVAYQFQTRQGAPRKGVGTVAGFTPKGQLIVDFNGPNNTKRSLKVDPKQTQLLPKAGDQISYTFYTQRGKQAGNGTVAGTNPQGKVVVDFQTRVGTRRTTIDPQGITNNKPAPSSTAQSRHVLAGISNTSVQHIDSPKLKEVFVKALQQEVCGSITAQDFFDALNQEGYQVYLVGGAIRDALMVLQESPDYDAGALVSEKMKDIDVVTTTPFAEVKRIGEALVAEKEGKVETPHSQHGVASEPSTEKFGVITFRGSREQNPEGIDIATIRVDNMFSPNKYDEIVFDHDLNPDAVSRDFCCNMLYYDPHSESIIDPTNQGIADAKEMTLRLATNEYVDKNDMLTLRAVKYAQRGYKVDANSVPLLKQNAQQFFPNAHKLGSNLARIAKSNLTSVQDLSDWLHGDVDKDGKKSVRQAMDSIGLTDEYNAFVDNDAMLYRVVLSHMRRNPEGWSDPSVQVTNREQCFNAILSIAEENRGPLVEDTNKRADILHAVADITQSNLPHTYEAIIPFLQDEVQNDSGGNKPARELVTYTAEKASAKYITDAVRGMKREIQGPALTYLAQHIRPDNECLGAALAEIGSTTPQGQPPHRVNP